VRAEAKPTAVLGGAEPVTKLVPEPRPPADPPVPVVPVVLGEDDGDEPTTVAESAPETAKVELPAPAPEEPKSEPESAADQGSKEEQPGLLVTVARRTPNRVSFIAAGVVLFVVLALVLIVSLNGGDEPPSNAQQTTLPTQTAQPTPSRPSPSVAATTGAATPSPAPSSPGAGFTLPAGWRMHRDPSGFSVAVPEGWTQSREGTMIFFREQGGAQRLMGIDQSDSPKADPVADWTDQEASRLAANRYRNYQRVKIEAVDYWDKAADWEWIYTSGSGNRLHVLNRGFITAPNQAYAIYWSTLDSSWQANLSNFALIADSFQPARS
jgi:eukaryotic-like serine/threonine-protein kinase